MHTRRQFLKQAGLLVVKSLGLPMGGMGLGTNEAQAQRDELQAMLAYLAPYPWKQRILLQEYSRWGSQSPVFMSLATEARGSASSAMPNVISPLASWDIERQPNYSHGYPVEGVNHILVACFGSQCVNSVNTATDTVTRLETGPNTNPLDVAYD